MSAVLRDAWDKGDLRILTKSDPICATNAHISFIGHITRQELRYLMSSNDMTNGLANRILWVCVRRSKLLPDGGNLCEDDLHVLAGKIRRVLDFASSAGKVTRGPEAREIWHAIYGELSAGKSGLVGAALSRAEAHVLRLSMTYALLDGTDVIGASHLNAAIAVWEYCERSARYIFGSNFRDPIASRILDALTESVDGMTRTQINNLFKRHRTGPEISEALTRLKEDGLARCEQRRTSGRNAEIWFACS